jgi:hypothetical protein
MLNANTVNKEIKARLYHSISSSKDHEATRRIRRRIFKYVEEADDDANKVSRRKRNGMKTKTPSGRSS